MGRRRADGRSRWKQKHRVHHELLVINLTSGPWGKVMYAVPFGIATGVCFSKTMAELSSAPVLALFRENEPPSELTRRPPLWLPFNAAGFDGFLETIERACIEVRSHYDEYSVGTPTEIRGPTDRSIIPEWFQVQEGRPLGNITDSVAMFLARCTAQNQLDRPLRDRCRGKTLTVQPTRPGGRTEKRLHSVEHQRR